MNDPEHNDPFGWGGGITWVGVILNFQWSLWGKPLHLMHGLFLADMHGCIVQEMPWPPANSTGSSCSSCCSSITAAAAAAAFYYVIMYGGATALLPSTNGKMTVCLWFRVGCFTHRGLRCNVSGKVTLEVTLGSSTCLHWTLGGFFSWTRVQRWITAVHG